MLERVKTPREPALSGTGKIARQACHLEL